MSHDGKRVLVLDDNQDIRDLIIHILDAAGFHVFSAADGESALGILNVSPVDLVLLDVMLPGMSGIDVLREIRTGKNKKLHEVPVMMITAKSGTTDIDEALAIGANSYIVKPFRGQNLREKIDALLSTESN